MNPPDLTAVKDALKKHQIELPSWAFGNSGTRFKVFGQPGVPRNPYEKAEDAAQVHKYTGVAPTMAVHIPWDKVDDYAALTAHAKANGIGIGAVNANVFQDDDYRLGSVCGPDPKARAKALAHLLECVDIMDATGSRDLKLWFADGTNYPGQDDIAARQDRLAEALAAVYARLGHGQRLLLEYKLFEPSFYTTDVPDWGTALLHCTALGDAAQVVVDTGHHAPGVNIEFIVALLLKAGKLGGFDFNSRFYADDDLMVGAADPFQLFRILHEVVKAGALYPGQPEITGGRRSGASASEPPAVPDLITARSVAVPEPPSGIAFMLDQCHNIEPKIPAQLRSVMNVQEATAKALLVDAEALRGAQLAGDVLGANAVLMDAYNTDVRPLLAELRQEMGLAPDPVAAYLASGYADKIVAERVGGTAAGWGA
jgi:L-rhamnose isomerase/sugar isomerase